MPSKSVIILLVLFCLCQYSVSTATGNASNGDIPTFTIEELLSRQRQTELKETLGSTGLLAVRWNVDEDNGDTSPGFSMDRYTALQGLCECHDHPEFLSNQQQQTRSIVLPDGVTKRVSVGTATIGMDHPLPLPGSLGDICGSEIVDAMEQLRDKVADVSKAFVTAMNGLIEEHTHPIVPLLRDKYGDKKYSSLSEIVESANHLEHFHVYSRGTRRGVGEENRNSHETKESTTTNAAWDWHTDAGLFLVFVPALDCVNDTNDSSFWYKNANGNSIQATFDGSKTAIVMLGQGAEDWLNMASPKPGSDSSSFLKLKATVHSVRWHDPLLIEAEHESIGREFQEQRAWYGMMYLVPETALVYGSKSLNEVRKGLSLSSMSKEGFDTNYVDPDASVALGCGVSEPTFEGSHEVLSSVEGDILLPRRRLQHQDPSACNNVTNFFCWMQCLEVPSANQAQGYVNEGYSLYCLDPAVLASSGNRVSAAVSPCEGGFVHNANCLGSWQPTAPGVPAATINVTADASDIEEPFCYSGTTMYMDGFHFIQSTTCVIFLFQSWVLDTGGKYALAFLGTLLSGICLEKLIQQRRKFMATMAAGRKRLLFSATFYGIQLTIGYMLMLVIMIYSGALFISTVMGLVFGHVFFNAKDAIWPLKTGATTLVIPDSEDGTNDGSYRGENIEDLEQTFAPAIAAAAERTLELSTELTNQSTARTNVDKHQCEDDVQKSSCCGKGQTAEIRTDPGDQLIPEGSTPCCQYSSCD